MRIRFLLPALMIGAGLLLPTQTPAEAKTHYKQRKIKKAKHSKRYKAHKVKHKAPKHR